MLVDNIKKIEKIKIKDITGNVKRISKITIGATALGFALITANKISNNGPVVTLANDATQGNCCLRVESNTITLEELFLEKCKEAISNMDSNSKSYVQDDVILDVIRMNIAGHKKSLKQNNILDDGIEYESLEEQIKIVADNISTNSEKYKVLYDNIFSDDIEECLGVFTLTAYCPCAECCDKEDGLTASGAVATPNHTIATDKRFPFGTKLMINGIVYTVEDVGGAINGNHIDVFYSTHSEALEAGTISAKVYLIKPEEKKSLTK